MQSKITDPTPRFAPPSPTMGGELLALWEPTPNPSQEEGSCCAEYTCFKVIYDESAWYSPPFGRG